MAGSFPPMQNPVKPPCPSCGSNLRVVRMPDSLTPFERPNMRIEEGGRFYCQDCAREFEAD
jgi:hypothetical protein